MKTLVETPGVPNNMRPVNRKTLEEVATKRIARGKLKMQQLNVKGLMTSICV